MKYPNTNIIIGIRGHTPNNYLQEEGLSVQSKKRDGGDQEEKLLVQREMIVGIERKGKTLKGVGV